MGDEKQIEKLTGPDNFPTWKIVMKIILECDGTYGVISGQLSKPKPGIPNYDEEYEKWVKLDAKAKKRIVLSLETNPLLRVCSCSTALEMWMKLSQIYDVKSTENIDILRNKFHNITWESTGGIQSHLAKFDEVQTQLTMLEKPIDEGDLCARLLQTLPKEFDYIYVTWHDTPNEMKTWEALQKKCLNYELRLKDRDEVSTTVAMVSNMKVSDKPKQFKKIKNFKKQECNKYGEKREYNKYGEMRCFSCGKIGHITKNCRTGIICFKCHTKGHKAIDCKQDSKHLAMMVRMKENYNNSSYLSGCDEWLVDSGASHHVTNRRDWFVTYTSFDNPKKMDSARQGVHIEAHGSGRVNVKVFNGNEWSYRYFDDVWFCPDASYNLFSVRKAAEKGIDQMIKDNGKSWIFSQNGTTIALAKPKANGDLYHMVVRVIQPKELCFVSNSSNNDLQSWHERLGHQNHKYVHSFLKSRGIDTTLNEPFCEGCVMGKHQRDSFEKKREKSNEPGQLIYADICGPMEEADLHGHRYFLVFKDDFSSFRVTFLLRKKDEVKDKLPIFVGIAKNQAQISIKGLRTDGGKEFNNKDIREFTDKNGIHHSVTCPYTPQQNGVAERENRILCEMARSWMMSAPHLPKKLWGEAVLAATHTLNRTGPTKVKGKTPIEIFMQKEAEFKHLKSFGCECFAWIPYQKRKKFDAKSRRGYLVGYDDCGYRIFIPDKNTIEVSRDVKFNPVFNQKNDMKQYFNVVDYDSDSMEESTIRRELVESNNVNHDQEEHNNNQEEDNNNHEQDEHNSNQDEGEFNIDQDEERCDINQNKDERQDKTYNLRRRSNIKVPARYKGNSVMCMNNNVKDEMIAFTKTENETPGNYEEAIRSEKASEWKSAMDDEISSLIKNKTYDLVDLPAGGKVVDNRWVYTLKTNSENEVIRHKARLVAKGYTQRPGTDYNDTFSPVARFETMRVLLGYAVQQNLTIKQFDVKTAFLNGRLEEEVYMRQPRGYEDGTDRVCRLRRSIYGLKQASKCWYKCLIEFLFTCNLNESIADPCMFYRNMLFVFFHVDDGMIIGDEIQVRNLIEKLKVRFEIVVHEADYYLGLQIQRGKDYIHINQTGYINKILLKYGMSYAKPLSLPIEPGWTPGDSPTVLDITDYRQMVGSLLYLETATRPDIAFAVGVAARVQDKPTQAHVNLVKRIFRYLKGTTTHGITFKKSKSYNIEAFSDADFAGNKETRRSTSGILIKLFEGPIVWKSKLQKCVSQSSMEAEYVAASEACKSIVWVDRLVKEVGIIEVVSIPILYIDNQSALKLMNNPMFHDRSKHIETRYHYVRQLVMDKKVIVDYIPSKIQEADILTKGLSSVRQAEMKKLIGVGHTLTKCD